MYTYESTKASVVYWEQQSESLKIWSAIMSNDTEG